MSFFLRILVRIAPLVLSSAMSLAQAEVEEAPSVLQWRKNTLEQLDEWLVTLTPAHLKSFPLASPHPSYQFEDPPIEYRAFSIEHDFFSSTSPLIGRVSEDPQDIRAIEKALVALMHSPSPFFIELATAEVLSKALAYRNLSKGMKIHIPSSLDGKIALISYEVDEVLDLWQEMPAFGLLPQDPRYHPILLFRGTDLSLASKKSWASLLSDLDLSGSGLSTFHFARQDIHAWLHKAYLYGKQKGKVMGFSLGGILALYTTFFELELVAEGGCIAFNPPGISPGFARKWMKMNPSHVIYITQGDLIPKLGIQPSSAFALFGKDTLAPIEAHTKLMTAENVFFMSPIATSTQDK